MIVFISALGIFFSASVNTVSNSVFIDSYIRDLRMDHTTISGLYSIATLLSGMLLLGIGRMVDRLGSRFMLVLSVVLLGLVCFWNSYVWGTVSLFIGFFMLRLLALGAMTIVPNTLVSQWFTRRRGRALSLMNMGGLLGAACFPLLINWLIETYGWRIAWMVLGIFMFIIYLPVSYFFVRNTPEAVGLQPDGESASPAATREPTDFTEISWTLSEAMKKRAFWFLLVCAGISPMIYTGISFQIFSIMGEQGIDRITTAFIVSLIPLISFVFSIVAGFIAERVRVHAMIGFSSLLNVAAPALLYLAESKIMVFLFAVIWGISLGCITVPLTVVWPNYFGRKYLGSISSISTTASVIGAAAGPIWFGWAFDLFGSYDQVLLMTVGIWVFSSILAFMSTPPVKAKSVQPANII